MNIDTKLCRILETALLCAEQSLPIEALASMFEPEAPSRDALQRHLAELQREWKDRGLELVELADGWRFRSRQGMQPYLTRLLAQLSVHRPARYSRAVLETLAIIAWRQPVTRGDIEDVRGVSVSTAIIRTLEERGWISIVGYRDAPGRPALFGTTPQFLSDLGLKGLHDLPRIAAARADPAHDIKTS